MQRSLVGSEMCIRDRACAAKYYEDMGYFGHVNCSDNFNSVLEAFQIAPRKGWAAANFFFNTGIDDHNVLYSDEPWSRPGDYVLMQAQTDLICVSSACPDDTSPANGWQPTDIHVRIYPKKNNFTKAITTRMTPDSDAKLTQETAFHPRTSALTRNFTCLLYTSPSPRDYAASRMPSSA